VGTENDRDRCSTGPPAGCGDEYERASRSSFGIGICPELGGTTDPVTMADKQLYQFYANVNLQAAGAYMHFTVPAGKKFVAQNINLSAYTSDPSCTFSAYGQSDVVTFSLALNKSAAPLGINTMWGGQNQVQFTAQTGVDIWFNTSGCTHGNAIALISGYIY
jgi:hypothetical protein